MIEASSKASNDENLTSCDTQFIQSVFSSVVKSFCQHNTAVIFGKR